MNMDKKTLTIHLSDVTTTLDSDTDIDLVESFLA